MAAASGAENEGGHGTTRGFMVLARNGCPPSPGPRPTPHGFDRADVRGDSGGGRRIVGAGLRGGEPGGL